MEGNNRCCKGCQTKDVNVTLRQNDMVMCDMCWGQPMSSDYIYYRSIVNIEDTHDTDAVEENGEEKNDNVDTEKIDREKSLAILLDETESPAILECATPSHSQIMHDTRPTEEDGVSETSQEKPVEDEKIESTPQALITKEDNILEHESDNMPTPSTNRQTSEHESQDGGHDTIHTEEQIATGILFADTLTRSLNKRKTKGKEIFKWKGSLEDLKSFVELILKRKGTCKGKKGKKQNFQDNEITLHWTPSSKTLGITGPKETVEKTEELLNTLIQNAEVNTSGKEENTEDPDCTITKDEIESIWTELNKIKNILQDDDGKPKVELNEKKHEQKNDISEPTDETMKYKDTRITDFFPKIKKSEVSLIEGLRIRINKLEQERNMITKQLNELKEKQIKTTSKGKQQNIKQHKESIPKSRKKSPSKNRVSAAERNSKSKPPPADKSKPPKTPVTPARDNRTTAEQQQQQLQKENRVQDGRRKSSSLVSGKEKIFIVGDSLIRNLNGWMMSRRKAVKIHSFSGSTVQELDLFIKPLLARKPHHVILLIGTNDIPDKNMTAETIAEKIMEIGKKIEDHGIRCTISELVTRSDVSTYNNKVKSVNMKLKEITAKTKIGFV